VAIDVWQFNSDIAALVWPVTIAANAVSRRRDRTARFIPLGDAISPSCFHRERGLCERAQAENRGEVKNKKSPFRSPILSAKTQEPQELTPSAHHFTGPTF
jgi:hypothetical protein